MENLKVAMRYAKAVYPVAKENNFVDTLLQDLNAIAKLLNKSRDLKIVFYSPVITQKKKIRIYDEIFKDKLSPESFNFVRLLLHKGRERLIKDIHRCFTILYNKDNRNVEVQIVSAKELADEAKAKLIQYVEKSTNMHVLPEFQLAADIIGGMKLRINDWVYDASIQNKLRMLKKELVA